MNNNTIIGNYITLSISDIQGDCRDCVIYHVASIEIFNNNTIATGILAIHKNAKTQR